MGNNNINNKSTSTSTTMRRRLSIQLQALQTLLVSPQALESRSWTCWRERDCSIKLEPRRDPKRRKEESSKSNNNINNINNNNKSKSWRLLVQQQLPTGEGRPLPQKQFLGKFRTS